ncbi:MAG: tandem-95 repeat protein, partial [Candidatus Marinimicrobia bacterium]|nr:tandem-95 repeat protein [Candidatus Neomarinimicrobiota bacterium]
ISTAIADQATTQTTFNESVATEVYFTVGDVDTVVDLLTLTVTSSNTTLVPNGNITIGGGGADRKVTIFPASNQSGSTTITLTVSDGYAIGESVSFLYSTVRPNPLPSMSLSDLGGKTGFRFDGAQSDSMLGQSVSGAGDINRDGFEDIIITSDNGQSAYVVFGKEGILEITSDLSTLNGSDGFRLMLDDDGNINDSILVASSIGDINGDNYDDLGLGIRGTHYNGPFSGSVYVIFGKEVWGGVVNLSTYDNASIEGFRLDGSEQEKFGSFVDAAGDFNGDGYGDLVIGAASADHNGEDSGSIYVLYGHSELDPFPQNLLSLNRVVGLRVDGESEGDFFGGSVSGVGDYNQDGFDDVIAGSSTGYSYLIPGGNLWDTPRTAVSIRDRYEGIKFKSYDNQHKVNSVGDFNGDGFSDVMIGSPDSGQYSGSIYIIKGEDRTNAYTQEWLIKGIGALKFDGVATDDQSGWSTSSAGDFNGDGIDDVIIGAPFVDTSDTVLSDAGASYIVFGKEGWWEDDFGWDFSMLDGDNGFRLDGVAAGNESGRVVSSAGDVNGDGFDDLILGASQVSYSGEYSLEGSSYIVFGGRNGWNEASHIGSKYSDTLIGTNSADQLISGMGADELIGNGGSDVFYGGPGDDLIRVGDEEFFKIDGGGGSDTLVMPFSLDLLNEYVEDGFGGSKRYIKKIQNIEKISLEGGGNNVLALGLSNVRSLTESNNMLAIIGDIGDRVKFDGKFTVIDSTGEYCELSLDASDTTRLKIQKEIALLPQVSSIVTMSEDSNVDGLLPLALMCGGDNSTLTYRIVSQPAHGSVSLTDTSSGQYSYKPNANYDGTDSFSIVVNDGSIDSSAVVISVEITAINDVPETSDTSLSLDEDQTAMGTLDASDNDGDVLTYTLVTNPSHGVVVLNSENGVYMYTPESNYTGVDSFTFKVNDSLVDSSTATASIMVNAVNDPPVSRGGSEEERTLFANRDNSIQLPEIDDPDSDQFTYTVTQQPIHGVLTGNSPNLTYTPNDGYIGSDSFNWKVSDGSAESDVVTVTLSVVRSYTKIANDGSELPQSAMLGNGPNDWACTRDDDTGYIWEVKSDDGGLRDRDHTYSWYSENEQINGGEVGIQNSGSCAASNCDTDGYVSAINEQELCGFTDWRVPGVSELKELVYCGNDVSYPLSDAEGCGSGALLPSIRQDFFPSAPEAAAWSLLTDYSNTNRAWLVDFSSGSLSTELKGGNGYVRLVNGQRALNAAPVISPIGDQITNEDVGSEVTFTIADAESGPDLLLLGVSSSNTSLVSNGNITIAEAGANRTVTLQPSENQYGTTEITLILSDGIELSAEYFTLSVLSVNDIPDATDQSIQVEANSDASGTLKTIDIDGDPLSYAIVISPAHGKVTLDEANTGEYVYTPNEHFFGSDLFTFKASDGSGNSNVATVFITISGESSNAPLASDAVLVVGMNRTIIGNLSGTDPDGDTLSYSITTQPNHGIVTITDVETGLYQYAPFEDYTGSDSFRYKTSDSLYDSNIAVVSISVNSTPTVFNKSATFSSATNSWSGGSGGSVVYTGNPVDIDGDGDIDFIAAFESFHKVVWYENDGYGNFDAHLIATVDKSIYVTSVYAEDVDGDGDMDVISPYSSSELAWYENDGNGRFSIHVIPSIEGRPGNVHADDVDSDGDVDLLSGLSWYENDGNENFIGHTITTETGYGSLIYAADIDGDDDMDLLTASSADDKIAWFENNGSEIFIAHTITTSADNVRSVHVNDLDGDGDMDILSASMSDNKIAWYENDGSESFSTHIVTQSLKYARNVFSVDVDLDGDMDIVTGSSDPNGIAWFENDGDENFSSQNVNTSNFSVYRGFRGFVADADGDGDLDLFSAQSKIWYENLKEVTYSEGHGPVTLNDSLMLSGGAGNSISSATIQLGSGFLAGQEILIFSDSETIIGNWNSTTGTLSLTGNDTVENYKTALHSIQYQNNSIFYENSTRLVTIAVSDSGLTSTPLIMRLNLTKENYAPTAHDDSLSVQLNRFYEGFLSGTDSDGNNITYSIVTPPSHGSVVIADAALGTYLYTPDFNFSGNDSFSFKANDGVSDSNTAEVSIMVSDLPVLSNIATGGFSMIEVSPFWTASTYASTYASDIDSDGDMDLITVSNNEVAWYENDGYENFSLHVVSTAVSSYTSVYATDIDGDSDIDLLSASYSNDEVAWYENDGNENFTTHIISTSANGVKSVYAIDVDGDDDIDLLSASILDDEIVWYKNDGSEQFTTHIVATDADGAQSVHAVDVDGDGDIDLLSASENDRKVAWYENDGSENFTARIVSDNAYGVRSIYAVDMDTDGDVDLVSYSYYGMKIVWYENDGNENFTDHIVSSGQYFSSVYASDLDNDGDIDLLSGSGSPRYILWHENDGNENFTDHILDESLSAASVYAVDVDGDGSMDIFTSGGKVRWYKNQGRLNYNDGDGNVVLNQSISINSSRDYLDSATIKFDSGYVSGLDKLSFSDTSTITGEWNESIGVMTLTGNDTIENYQIALRSVKYININDDPNILKRVLSIAVADSTGESTPLTMQINISAVNDSPIVSDAAISTQVGQDVSSTLIGLDPEGDSLTYSVVTPPSHGSVSIINEATGLYHYMPTNGYDGLDSFTFKLNDGLLDSAVGTVLITVHKMPILLDRSATTFSNRAKLLALSDKDSSSTYTVDVDGDGDLDHLYASFFDSKIGWEENDGNGDYTFHSIANADQTTSILSSDLDSDGDLDIITAVYFGDTSRNVWYENNGNNQFTPHVFTSMILNYLTSIFASDIDNDGDIDLLTASDLNYLIWHKNDGNETFTYHQVYNSTKGITSVFAVDLDGDHDVDLLAASALDNKIAWYENDGNEDFYNSNVEHIVTTEAYYTSSLYAADVDNDGDVDIITSSSSEGVFWYENDGSGTFVAHTVTTSAQSAYSIFLMDVDSDGDLDILSESSSGERDIWYENKMHMLQYMDGAGAVTLNNALTLVKASIANLTGATVQFTNGFSADQDELLFTDTATITGVWNDSSGTLTLSGIDTIEHYEQALRSIQYQNNKDAPDTSDRTLSIVVADGSVFSNYLSMKIEITAINDAPVVNNDTLSTQEDADAGSILNGVDPEGDVLSYSIVTPPEHGTLLLLNAKLGTYRYSPNTDYTGSDSFTFKANDGDVESNLATVTITVTPVNDLPAVNNSALSGSEDQSLVLNETKFIPSYVDTEGDPLAKVRIVSLPASGLLRMGAGTVTVGMEITVDDLDQLIYEPEADWFGTVSFKWDGSDGKEYSKISAVMTINLGESNDSPTGTGTTLTTGEDISVDGQVTAIDPEGDPLNFVSAVSPSYGVLVLATNGTFTYTPENNYNGTDTFIIRASDGKGGEVDLKASVTITPVNDLPSMSRNRGKTLQDGGTITLSNDDLLAIDPESDGVVRYHITSEPINGTIVMDGAPIGIGGGFTQEDINLGRLAYHHDVAGTNSDSFSFKLEDDQGGEVTIIHTFLINIEVVNNAPVAVAETWTTDEDTPISVILQGSDEDGDNIIYELFGLSSLGKADLLDETIGSVRFTPDLNVTGHSSFRYRLYDGEKYSETVQITVIVNPLNDPPIAEGSVFSTFRGTAVQGNLIASDVDQDVLKYSVGTFPTRGILQLDESSGEFVYTPYEGFEGPDSFTFQASDGKATSEHVVVTVVVAGDPSLPPVVNAMEFSLLEDEEFNGQLLGSDPEEDPLSFKIVGYAQHGWVGIENAGTGAFRYTPKDDYHGLDLFSYVAHDGNSESKAAVVELTVIPVNDAPTISGDPAAIANLNEFYQFTPQISDDDGDLLTIRIENLPQWASFNEKTGAITGTPTQQDLGSYSDIRISVA